MKLSYILENKYKKIFKDDRISIERTRRKIRIHRESI